MGPLTFAILLGGLAGVLFGTVFGKKGRREQTAELKILIQDHENSLRRNFLKCCDEYGTVNSKMWKRQCERFFDSVSFRPHKIGKSVAISIVTKRMMN